MEIPRGRQPKRNLAVRPQLAKAFRYVARKERVQLSDLFHEMFSFWLKRKRAGQYKEIELNENEADNQD